MRRRVERLDQQLGDFAPLQQRLNQLQLERILARNTLTLLPDYQQILLENRDDMQLPGWWYRGLRHEYLGAWTQASQYKKDRPRQDRTESDGQASIPSSIGHHLPVRPLYRAINDIVTPSPDAGRCRSYPGHHGYARSRPRAYR